MQEERSAIELPATDEPDDSDPEDQPDTIARRLSVSEIVDVFEQSEREIRAAFGALAATERRLNDAFSLKEYQAISIRDRYQRTRFDAVDDTMECVRRQVWQSLVERLELRRFMSIQAWEELERQLKNDEPPEITHEIVSGMAEHFRSQMPSMLEAAVQEVFNWLRPPRSHHKTNSQFEVPRKVILSGVVERGYGRENFRVSYYYEPNLTALENVFNGLDGRGSVSKDHYSALSTAIKQAGSDGRAETDLFRVRCFKNRNLHVEFLRLDLLEKFNAIAGGKRLRGNRGG